MYISYDNTVIVAMEYVGKMKSAWYCRDKCNNIPTCVAVYVRNHVSCYILHDKSRLSEAIPMQGVILYVMTRRCWPNPSEIWSFMLPIHYCVYPPELMLNHTQIKHIQTPSRTNTYARTHIHPTSPLHHKPTPTHAHTNKHTHTHIVTHAQHTHTHTHTLV